MQFSANLGFLWPDKSLIEAVYAAQDAGFSAVECHWPFDTPAQDLRAALEKASLSMLSINARPGDLSKGDFGLTALPERVKEARNAIDEALDYAAEISCAAVHVMAGKVAGDEAHQTFLENLRYATARAADEKITVLIEPLNSFDVPEYFLKSGEQTLDVLQAVGASNLKLMFDCYHFGRSACKTTDAMISSLQKFRPHIGHIQFASVPERRAPDQGDISYQKVFQAIADMGWAQPLGAEYHAGGGDEQAPSWLEKYKSLKPNF